MNTNFENNSYQNTLYENNYGGFSGGNTVNSAYSKIMLWLTFAFLATGVGTLFIGPLVPYSMINGLWVVALIALIVSGFMRNVKWLAPALTIFIPTILGVILYPTLNYYFATGSGDIVLSAAFGTAVVFGISAIIGWNSKVNKVESKMPIMTGVLIALILTSVLNVFIFQMEAISFIISLVTIPLFALYSYYDLNKIKNHPTAKPAASYALDIFLDIYNIFVSILNIIGIFRN